MENILLTREQFKELVFKRDGYKCLVCKEPADDAHHIIERKLFLDGGYFIDNGASVCSDCHIKAEQTIISCEELRALAGITNIVLPDHLYKDQVYDKWANPILNNGLRLRGELFQDASVQKILQPVLHLFTDKCKYSRTYHLPFSQSKTDDDKTLDSVTQFENKEVVVTLKYDGEGSSLYKDDLHARSLEYKRHPSRNRLRVLHANIKHLIPDGWRICGENLQAKHSIHYQNLPDFFLVFSIWDERNVCLSWDDTCLYAGTFDLQTVPVLYRGIWNEELIKNLHKPIHNGDECEGFVVRLAGEFHYKNFRNCTGKFVRGSHVTTSNHWAYETMVENKICLK